MDKRLAEHLELLTKYLDYLEAIKKVSKKEFLSNFTIRGACERYLQLAIETCINLGNRIIALQRYTNEIPGNYAEIFVKLGQINIYPDDFAAKMVSMAKFRNKLVHGYWQIDPSMVYLILQEDISDIYQFRNYLIEFLTK